MMSPELKSEETNNNKIIDSIAIRINSIGNNTDIYTNDNSKNNHSSVIAITNNNQKTNLNTNITEDNNKVTHFNTTSKCDARWRPTPDNYFTK